MSDSPKYGTMSQIWSRRFAYNKVRISSKSFLTSVTPFQNKIRPRITYKKTKTRSATRSATARSPFKRNAAIIDQKGHFAETLVDSVMGGENSLESIGYAAFSWSALFGLGLARPRFLPGSGSNLTGVIFASTRFLGSYPKWWRRYASSSPSQGGGTRVWSLPSQGGGGFVGLSSPSQGGDKVGRGGGGGGLAYSLGIDLFLSHGSVLSLILYPSQTAKFRLHFPVSSHYS